MKKILLFVSALAGLFLAGSCQREELAPVAEGNVVTFEVALPEVATKAAIVDDGSNINNLVYAVYRTEADDLASAATSIDPTKLVYSVNPKAKGEVTSFTSEGKTNVTLELINNQKYIVLFWAQVNQTWVTGSEFDLTNISYPKTLTANQSKYAAFSGAAFVDEVTGATQKSVTLTRPFAQINLASTDPANYDVDIVSSSVKIENVYPSFNVATQKAYGDFRTVEYATEENPDGKFGDYDHYIAMNYIFANPQNEGTTPVDVTCTINTASHGEGIVKEVSNVPVAKNYRTNIIGNLLTSDVDYTVELEKDWAGNHAYANTTEAVQYALDCASDGSIIQLEPGVHYGTLYIRPVEGQSNTITDCDYLVYRNEMLRKVENLTIKGATGATVDAIVFVSGHIEGSTGYVVDIKNLVIDSVEFTDKHTNAPHNYAAPIFIDLSYINVDGLTVNNCKLDGNNDKMNLVYLYTSGKVAFDNYAKNITISNNTVDGIARLCELRQTENVTITGNTIKNTALHGMLLTVSGGTYSGNVTITENTADGINERFVRMAGAGDANVVIKDNTITNYYGADADYIKVEGGNVTIENNAFYDVVEANTAQELESLVNDATKDIVISFANDLEGWITLTQKKDIDVTILGNGKTYTGALQIWGNAASDDRSMTIQNINFVGDNQITSDEACIYTPGKIHGHSGNSYACNVTIEDCTFTGEGIAAIRQNVAGEKDWTIRNCTVNDGMHSLLQVSNTNKGDSEYGLLVEKCKVYSKNGANLNYTCDATFNECIFDVQGYAVRVGVDDENGNNAAAKEFNFTDCTFTSENLDNDAVVIVRKTAQNATLNFNNTTLTGTPQITGHENAKVYVNGVLQVANRVLHNESGLYYNGNNNDHKSVFYIESADDLKKAAAYFNGQTHSNEANYVTIDLLTNIDLAGQEWTPWNVQYITFNGNNHTISNMNVSSSWRGGFFGYGGPVKVNDLTIKNATVNGAQAGIVIGSAEGATVSNVKIAGNNTITYVPYADATHTETWGGIGVFTGVLQNSTINGEIVSGATIDINTNGIVTEATYVDLYTGYISANKGTVVNNGTVSGAESWYSVQYAYTATAQGTEANITALASNTTVYRGVVSEGALPNLVSVTVGEGISRLNNRSLCKNPNLEVVNLPSSLTYIDEGVFQQTGIKSITIPENVTYIGKTALGACSNLETIIINAQNVTIANYCARGCVNLRSVYLNCETVTFAEDGNGNIHFSNEESNNNSQITFYVANQGIADALNAIVPAGHAKGMKIKSLDGNTEYYTR